MDIAAELGAAARELGFEALGAVGVGGLAGYLGRVDERERAIPLGEGAYAFLRGLADPARLLPGARSLVVAVWDLERYSVPEGARGLIGRNYLFDCRRNPAAPESAAIAGLTALMGRLGLRCLQEEHPGVAPMRWAAWKAGLGIIRRNNFFYTASGSRKHVAAWAVDRELESPPGALPPPCPEGCGRCAGACPTGSLSGPYVMNMRTCASYLTTLAAEVAGEGLCRALGGWLYGCDACQDACPFNRGGGGGGEEFPGLAEAVLHAAPERILAADLAEIGRTLGRKFFYIGEGALHRWKVNALNVIANAGRADLSAAVRGALADASPEVRRKAAWTLARLEAG
ncbi:MAG: epoxyqueuosine reductase [Deltaproteobacteria bacterium]|jgi:epoxyqueuosine reductase|nr:epoxyqueuosine reductase [Deltaproteobacteria bacterium]